MRNKAGFARSVALLGGVTLAGFGAWAFLAPESFYENLAVFPPFNRHFIHDIGAFQIGLGAVLLLAIPRGDALFVALAGVAIGSAVHVVSHVLDNDLGGEASDIPLLTILTVLLIAGAFAAVTSGRAKADDATRPVAPRE